MAVVAVEFTGIDLVMLLAILLLLVVLIFFAVAETSLNRISRVKAQAIADSSGTRSAQALARLVTHPERFINPVLVTVTICQTGQAFLTSLLADRLFGPVGILIGFVLNVVVFFVLSEAMPKTWAVLSAERAALLTARPTEMIVSFPPLKLVSRGLIGLTNVLLPGKGLKEGPFVSEQEFLGIVEAAAEDEIIEHEERQLIESIIEFGDTVAREIMVPRPDVVTIAGALRVSAALDLAIEHGYSRMPVVGEDDDDIIGVAYTKDLMRLERAGRGDEPVAQHARAARFIPENLPVSRLMREMQEGKFHVAMVADEYGDVVGLITLEDCLEELVGEILDEYDREESMFERLPNGDYLVAGRAPIHELNELLELRLPDGDWDTVGGFVFNTLEHVPEPGESFARDGWRFSVEDVEGRRVRRIRISVARLADDDRAGQPHVEQADASAPPDRR
jgi:putative hemolysin